MDSAGGSSSELKRVIGELTRGREMADQLLSMLREIGNESVMRTGGMVEKILDSFTGSLSILATSTATAESDEASQVVSSCYIINSPLAVTKTEDSGQSYKKPAPKDRRGCYKRRRTSETWTKETPTLYEDGHGWRKYGQKVIFNAKHPRNYFRCTHKYDQLCLATKHVQKIQDEPSTLYRTTYHGRHTCKKLDESSAPHHRHHQLLMDAAATTHDNSSIIWSFQSSQLGHHDNYKAPAVVLMKHEPHHHHHYNDNDNNYNKQVLYQTKLVTSHSDDQNNYLIPADPNNYDHNDQLTTFDTPSSLHNHHLSAFSSAAESDHGDVYSCTSSTVHNTSTMDIGGIMDFGDLPDF